MRDAATGGVDDLRGGGGVLHMVRFADAGNGERVNQLFAAPVQPLDSDERWTPRWVFDHMGLTFGTDPCSPVGGGDHVPAAHKYTARDDGLTQPWYGLTWCNPPFSNAKPFAERFIAHADGVFLGPVANSRWAQDMLEAADLTWLCADFEFVHPTHAGRRSSMPLMFCAIGEIAATGVRRLADSGVHRGCLMRKVPA